MTTCTPKAKREPVKFALDTPVTIALAYSEPKHISNANGECCMYSLADNRVLFAPVSLAQQITEAGINVREDFTLTRKRASGIDSWEIVRKLGEQSNGTFVVPAASPANPERKPIQRAAASLIDEANALVDAYATVLERALTTYSGRVKPEEARALLISAYIQRQKSAA